MASAKVGAIAPVLLALLGTPGSSHASASKVEAVLTNIVQLNRPGQDGLATVWDGNKYIQCRHMSDRTLRCEAAGALMQPSLARVLTPERIQRLSALGWRLDPSFGNYVQSFAAGHRLDDVAERILQALAEGYDADVAALEVFSDWIKSEPCPPRNGPSQNLAGVINDAPAMARTAVRGCAYKPAEHEPGPLVRTRADLLQLYGPRVAGEVQRLRVNLDRHVFIVIDTRGGYIQCGPLAAAKAIYCEAQSAESWPVLARILTPDRVAQLHAKGFADPGRAPNYWKNYPLADHSDAAIADELLTILYDIYRYNGVPPLKFGTERGR